MYLSIKRFVFFFACLLSSVTLFFSCGVYKFNDRSLDPNLKTINIQIIENRAPYVNPQLSPSLTERLRLRIVNQTKLKQTNGDNADLYVTGEIRDYAVTTTGISNQQAETNRLTVTVHIIVNNQLDNTKKEIDISRSFEFSARRSLQEAETQLLDEMVRNLTDDIFNRMFSTW
jgi:hypothetical protein